MAAPLDRNLLDNPSPLLDSLLDNPRWKSLTAIPPLDRTAKPISGTICAPTCVNAAPKPKPQERSPQARRSRFPSLLALR
jgi:hypothetical protein